MSSTKTIFLFLITILEIAAFHNAAPLSTSSRWIVDQKTGKRVKLTCVNWASHLQPMIAEGLEKKPLNYIVSQIAANGFNCVRFTWATFMFTRPSYFNLTVPQSLDKFNLSAAKLGVAQNNPQIMNMTIKEVHKAVVDELGKHNLMVVLDNHISQPKWCCGINDGNGFFGDSSFKPKEWLKGLTEVARAYKNNSAVVGMSLRNELRGKRQQQHKKKWYTYMQRGANTVHSENPNVLVIISGLYYDNNLAFLKTKPLELLNLKNKVVYEAHLYGFWNHEWTNQSNKVCAELNHSAWENYLFLTTGDNPFPLFLSEFGTDQSGKDEAGNRYITCLLAFLAENDIEWALWAFQGSYMLREGKVDFEESYGVMDFNWNSSKNPEFIRKLQFVRQMNQDPISCNMTYNYIIFHPQSGQCVRIGKRNDVFLDNCEKASRWDQHLDGGTIKLVGRRSRCLAMVNDGKAASVSNECSTKWKYVSSSGLHLAARINEQGEYLCMEKNTSNSKLVTNKCLCVGDDLLDLPTCATNPQVQWFKLVPTNRGGCTKVGAGRAPAPAPAPAEI